MHDSVAMHASHGLEELGGDGPDCGLVEVCRPTFRRALWSRNNVVEQLTPRKLRHEAHRRVLHEAVLKLYHMGMLNTPKCMDLQHRHSAWR